MKVYIGNVDWADEGDIFFFSVESEENLEAGFDIFERMSDKLHDLIWDLDYDISQEDLDRIKPLYIKLYDQKSWEDIQKWFDNKREHDD